MKRKQHFYSINAALASGVMYYVLELSKSGRTAIDWAVIGLVSCAILWNLIQLGLRLHSVSHMNLWHLLRTLTFWIVGLFNTVLLRPEDVGEWKHTAGWLFILLAIGDSIFVFMKERRFVAERAVDAPPPSVDVEQ